RTGVPGAVHRAVYPAGLLADVLHDVDLAAPGPAGGGDIIAQHPESGPQPLPTRYLNTGLDATVLPRAQPLGLKPGRGVFGSGERGTRGDRDPEQDAGHVYDFRYRQATIPAPVTFRSNAWLPLASMTGTSCFWDAITSPFPFKNSNVTAAGALGLALRLVNSPPSFAPCSSDVKVPTVTSTVRESATVR